jgi:hypothetical protein
VAFDERRIRRTHDGKVRLSFPAAERELLRGLPAELLLMLERTPDDPSLERLFPPAYEDADDEGEYRTLMGAELLHDSRRALELLGATADAELLDVDQADAWLRALNQLRLVLGTRLGVSEETMVGEVDPGRPDAHGLALYGYLSWLQEQLVEALSADLPG